jgi:hypothetical protein
MATLTHIETDTGTNVDISSATAIGSYTSTGDKLVMVDVSIDAVAGNGDYVMYVKRQINGTGSSYIIRLKQQWLLHRVKLRYQGNLAGLQLGTRMC